MFLASRLGACRGLQIGNMPVPAIQKMFGGGRSFAPLVPAVSSPSLELASDSAMFAAMKDSTFTQLHNTPDFMQVHDTPEASEVDPADKWKQITVEMWRDSVYINQTYFGELISDTNEFVKTIGEHIKLSGRRVSLVEVGCGTGEFVRALQNDFRHAVGVDFNEEFINFCKEHTPVRNLASTRFIPGDACHLNNLMKEAFPKTPNPGSRGVEFWDDARVVACVGNTIGIVPQQLRRKVYEEMVELAGKDGVLVMVYWNARWFGDACLNFYHANPKLCGPFDGENVDFKQTTLATPTKYKTKWTSVEEARDVMESLGLEIISLREKGKGVFVAARRF